MDDLDIAVIRKEFQYNYDYYVQKKKKTEERRKNRWKDRNSWQGIFIYKKESNKNFRTEQVTDIKNWIGDLPDD